MTIETQAAAPVAAEVPSSETAPFYRRPWVLSGLAFVSLFFWPLAVVPAILIWTGPVDFYLSPGRRVRHNTAAKVLFTLVCVAYMGWYGAKFAKLFAVPGCSDRQTLALVEQIINEKFLKTAHDRASIFPGLIGFSERENFLPFQVRAIRTVDTIAANGGAECAAQVSFPYINLSGSHHVIEFPMSYTVEPVDDRDEIFVQIQFGRPQHQQ